MITQEHVEKISDEFQSTFTLLSPTQLANCFAPHERNRVALIIEYHVPDVKCVRFEQGPEIAQNYFVWLMTVERE